LKTLADARKFLRDHAVVLWNGKAELPNLVDAILGRVAKHPERVRGRVVENCLQWRKDLLQESEFLECLFFEDFPTVLHSDLWSYATVFSRRNFRGGESTPALTREARKILAYLSREGSTRVSELRKALKFSSPQDSRLFHRARKELQKSLIILSRETLETEQKVPVESLDLWENCMPKAVRNRADQISEKDAKLHLLAATLNSCVLCKEKSIRRWFFWCKEEMKDQVETLVQKKSFLRLRHRNESWIVSRSVLIRQ
jgi:hypothetical protein